MLKATLAACDDKVLTPSLNFVAPTPTSTSDASPFRVNTELRDWPAGPDGVRRAGVSAFGFGGTNFHVVAEEYVPGRLREESAPRSFASAEIPQQSAPAAAAPSASVPKTPVRGALVLGGATDADIVRQLTTVAAEAAAGTRAPAGSARPGARRPAVRLAIDYGDAADLATKADKALKALATDNAAMWQMLRAQRRLPRRGPAPKVAFLYTGQGSQYVNMLDELRAPRAGRRRHLRRGRRGDDPDPRSSPDLLHLHRLQRRRGGQAARPAASADRDHPAGRAGNRPVDDPHAQCLRRLARYVHGPQPGRVRRAGRGRIADVRRTRSRRSAPAGTR